MRVGVLGAGQLGRMLGLAGIPLGMEFRFLDPAADPPAAICGPVTRAPFSDATALDALAAWADVITYEFENVPVSAAAHLAARKPVYPSPDALLASQDRLSEKQFFHSLGIPTAPIAEALSHEELRAAALKLGFPCIVKTRRMGYDGKGQVILRSLGDVAAAFDQLGGVPLLVEGWVPFRREVSSVAVRSRDGDFRMWPLFENVHRRGVLRTTRWPAELPHELAEEAERRMRRMMDVLQYVGVLTTEWFVLEGDLLANEMAPRVHNSGHLTIEAAETSQFENHLRAVTGLPLGACTPRGEAAMVNVVGTEPPYAPLLAMPGVHVHRYGKAPREGRKLGHVTLLAETKDARDRAMADLERQIP